MMRTHLGIAVWITLAAIHSSADAQPCGGFGRLAVTAGGSYYGEDVALADQEWGFATCYWLSFSQTSKRGVLDIWRRVNGSFQLHDQIQPFEIPGVDVISGPVAATSNRVAFSASGGASSPGAATKDVVVILSRSGSSWSLDAIVNDPFPLPGDGFGSDISLYGDRMLVGAEWVDGAALNQGGAYVYRRDPTGWVLEQTLFASDPAGADYFGHAVALSNDVAVISSPNKQQTGGDGRGLVYIFERSGNQWTQTARLVPSPVLGVNGWFGEAVDVEGTRVAVGRPGAVYLYAKVGEQWVEHQAIGGWPVHTFDSFGASLDLRGLQLAVGAPSSLPTSDEGSVYLYREVAGTWQPMSTAKPCGGQAEDRFGQSVALVGDTLLVGAPGDDYGSSSVADNGTVHVMQRNASDGFDEQEQLRLGAEFSASRGGLVYLHLYPSPGSSNYNYMVLGSLTGTSPGFSALGMHIPLNIDPYFLTLLSQPSGWFQNLTGSFYSGLPTVSVGAPPLAAASVIGARVHHAFITFSDGGAIVEVSEAESFLIEP